MKNYLVGAVRPVKKRWYNRDANDIPDNAQWQQDLTVYHAMYQRSRTSAQHFLQGDFEIITHSSPVLDARLFQIAQWYLVRELWFREPCNILCMGADTMFVRPTEIFGRFSDMRLFNFTDPKTHPDLLQYKFNGVYFNDDIRYFPASMDRKIWDHGEDMMSQWFSHQQSHWDCGQLIHNHMFWSQDLDMDGLHHPELAWQAFNILSVDDLELPALAVWNQAPLDQAQVLHLHSSRRASRVLEIMDQVWNRVQSRTC